MTGPRRGGEPAALETAWERSDRIFGLLAPGAMLARPIPLRQPIIFYLATSPIFEWSPFSLAGERLLLRLEPGVNFLCPGGVA